MVILIHDSDTDLYMPVCFVLCSNKNKDIYTRIFQDINDNILKRHCQITRVTLDFEDALKQAISEIFVDVEIIGCKFHLQQAF